MPSSRPIDSAPDNPPSPKLPNMNEFSPGTLGSNNIRNLLSIIHPYLGNKEGMIDSIIKNCPRIQATTNETQRKGRANNVLIGMSQCGLLVKDEGNILPQFSDVATAIFQCQDDNDATIIFSRHLLENCHGLELIDVVSSISLRGELINLDNIRKELRLRGFVVTENEGNASKIRQWLESASIIDNNWRINNERLAIVTGTTDNILGSWHSLTRSQRVFATQVKSLHISHGDEWIQVRQIKDLCEATHGRVFPEGRLRAEIISPLVNSGWLESRGTGEGRGGDSGQVKGTSQLCCISINLPIENVSVIPVDLRDKLSTPLPTIFSDITSSDTYIKGLALELLALRLISDIGLFPAAFRARSAATNGAEVDLIANGAHLHYSRWLIQCKNKPDGSIDVGDIAKEVGMAVVLKAHVVMMVTTGKINRSVYAYADGLASSTSLQAVLIDKNLLDSYRLHGASTIVDSLRGSALKVLSLKKLQAEAV